MANEATVRSALEIRVGNVYYSSKPGVHQENLSSGKGPSPGAITVPTSGKVVDLSELDSPGLCEFKNLDDTNFVTVGVYDGSNFFPLLELPPGKAYSMRLSRYLNQEFVGTGTGTNTDVNQLMLVADTAECAVFVGAFDD